MSRTFLAREADANGERLMRFEARDEGGLHGSADAHSPPLRDLTSCKRLGDQGATARSCFCVAHLEMVQQSKSLPEGRSATSLDSWSPALVPVLWIRYPFLESGVTSKPRNRVNIIISEFGSLARAKAMVINDSTWLA